MIRQRSVKVNIGWCENDYQVDIATAAGREEYKRIVDRASQLGITHLLFAPRNSDVSGRANNTDAWGWEQILWFGLGQKLRLGEWAPGQPLPASLQEMLDHFKLRGVRPIACAPICGVSNRRLAVPRRPCVGCCSHGRARRRRRSADRCPPAGVPGRRES